MFQAFRPHGLSWTHAGTSADNVQTMGTAVCSANCHEHKQRAGLGPRPHIARLCESSLGNHVLPVSVIKTLAMHGKFVKHPTVDTHVTPATTLMQVCWFVRVQ